MVRFLESWHYEDVEFLRRLIIVVVPFWVLENTRKIQLRALESNLSLSCVWMWTNDTTKVDQHLENEKIETEVDLLRILEWTRFVRWTVIKTASPKKNSRTW